MVCDLDEGILKTLGEVGSMYSARSKVHDYLRAPGVGGWRKDPSIKIEPFIGGG